MMTELNPKLVWREHGKRPGGPSEFSFFIACTEMNAYLAMKYLLKMDDNFMKFSKQRAKASINNSYTNDKT